MILILQR